MEVARQYQLRTFVPSTIGAFGPESPRYIFHITVRPGNDAIKLFTVTIYGNS